MYKAFVSLVAIASAVVAIPTTLSTGVLVPAAAEFQKSSVRELSDRAAQVNPTILFYPGLNCATGGFRLSIVDRLQNTCLLSTPPTFASLMIDNPDRTFLPITFWVSFTGNTCPTGIQQITMTNTCFNINLGTGNGWEIKNTGGGTF